MAVSPRSTISSDLYSPSEPDDPKSNSNGGSDHSRDVRNLLEYGDATIKDSECSDAIKALNSDGENMSRSASTASGPTPRLPPGLPHKRKREEDVRIQSDLEAHTSPDRREGWPVVPHVDRFSLLEDNTYPWSTQETESDLPRAKRPKSNERPSVSSERIELARQSTSLPAALWQHIFSFVPPVFLGRLLRVNKAFKCYLSGNIDIASLALPTPSIVRPMNPESIWIASRRRFAPGLPRPIHGIPELDMWRLLIGQNCQEFELYLSTCPSFLVPAIPFAFVSGEDHYIGHNLLKNHVAPSGLSITKQFYKPGIEEVMRKFEDVKALGSASAEEWIKGLASQGQERLEDNIRWEQWESRGGLKKVNSRYQPKPGPLDAVSSANRTALVKDERNSERSTPQSTISSIRQDTFQNIAALDQSDDQSGDHAHFAPNIADTTIAQSTWNGSAHMDNDFPSQTPMYHQRPERSIRDVNEAKAIRRAEIERRCAAMNPPLTTNLLVHMESFQAAIQITQPMTEQAWQILRPRLLTQLPYAERKEKERLQQDERLAEENRQRQQYEIQVKENRESSDREWETMQFPVRKCLGKLADEYIDSWWAGGRSVTKDTSPKFAADVLLHVRQQFYNGVVQEDRVSFAIEEFLKTDSPTMKLTLDHMKWLFDSKVKPLTDHFQRELFLCNGCDGNFKFYGFEGVIQHYAAKHTTTLSMGNVVVHWRAEWPEHPPFNPNPSVAKSAYYQVPTPTNLGPAGSGHDLSALLAHGDYGQSNGATSVPFTQQQEGSQYSMDIASATYAGPSPGGPPTALSAQTYPSQINHSSAMNYPGAVNAYSSSATSSNPYPAPQQSPVSKPYGSGYSVQQPYAAFAPAQHPTSSQPFFPGPNGHVYGNGQPPPFPAHFQHGNPNSSVAGVPGSVSDLYQRQMDEMAKHAKEVFIGIGGVKDLPGSVRVYVVIQLTVSRFKATFANEPSLTMFIDGLDHNAIMRPVRSVNGLGCKPCIQGGVGAKLFTLPHLVNHFRSVHMESPQSLHYPQIPELDWKTQMIDLPDASVISNLVNAAGMTDSKLGLIASVFQSYFPSPLPSVRGKLNTGPLPVFKSELDTTQKGVPRQPPQLSYGSATQFEPSSSNQYNSHPYSDLRPLYESASQDLPEAPKEDEYDPHRPAVLNKTSNADSASQPLDKPEKATTLQDGQRPSNQTHHEPNQRLTLSQAVKEISYDHPVTHRSHFHDTCSRRSLEDGESNMRFDVSKHDTVSRHGGPETLRADEQSVHDGLAKHVMLAKSHTPGYRSPHFHPQPSRLKARSPSPRDSVHVADQFLNSMASKSDADQSSGPRPLNYEIGYRPETHRQNDPYVIRHDQQFGENCVQGSRFTDAASINSRANDNSVHQVHVGPPQSRNDVRKSTPQGLPSHLQASEDFQMPLTATRVDQSPINRYRSRQNIALDRNGANGNAQTQIRSNDHTMRGDHLSHYKHVSVSPHKFSVDTALYRPRSPVEEDRGPPAYRVHAPPPRRQKEGPDVITGYNVPVQDQYEYLDDDGPREVRYQPRYEYVRVPLDYEDTRPKEAPPRYYISRDMDQVEPQYVHYEQAYAGEPIYERDGHYYQASRRTFQDQQPGAASSLPQSYDY